MLRAEIEQVAVGRLLDRVDVEEVVGDTGGRLARIRGAQRHVSEGVPLPQHLAGLDVDLLDDAVEDGAVRGPPTEVRSACTGW